MERYELVKFDDGESNIVIDLDDNMETFGVVNVVSFDDPKGITIDIYHNHNHNGSGCNNLMFDAFGVDLDLEFLHSREITAEEFSNCMNILEETK